MYRTQAIVLALIVCGLCLCHGAPQQQNYGSERLFDLSSIFSRYPSYQRPMYNPYGLGGGGGMYPGAGYPGAGGGYPGAGYPGGGTNMLGGHMGGGGVGGYGGNGGFSQYMGYNNPNYNGQRNLGYGYYRNSDSYGFTPSRDLNYLSGTGYRGYS